VSTTEHVPTSSPPRHSPAKARTVEAAIDLFTTHGVGATSLQMIADSVGITKAAIYHQFKTKDEIVIAAAEANMSRLEEVLDAAEAEPAPLEHLLAGFIDLAIEQRRMVNLLQTDPVMVRLLDQHPPFRALMDRLYRLLSSGDPSGDGRVPVAIISAAIGGAVASPLLGAEDHELLRAHLLDLAQRLLSPQ
jgi:AcrR family transcriptional regulator